MSENSLYSGNQRVNIDLNGDGRVDTSSKVIAFTPSNQEQFRPGNMVNAVFDVDHHNTVTGGWWYEYSNLLQFSPIGIVNQRTGIAADIWGTKYNYSLPNGSTYNTRNWDTLTQVNMLFLGDHGQASALQLYSGYDLYQSP